jgi:hypothetical protein
VLSEAQNIVVQIIEGMDAVLYRLVTDGSTLQDRVLNAQAELRTLSNSLSGKPPKSFVDRCTYINSLSEQIGSRVRTAAEPDQIPAQDAARRIIALWADSMSQAKRWSKELP